MPIQSIAHPPTALREFQALWRKLDRIPIPTRATAASSVVPVSAADHGGLSGLEDNDHVQYHHEVYVPLLAVSPPVVI